MTVHSYHPDVHEHGLQDGCPRCDEHANDPFLALDSVMIANLIERVNERHEPRSDNEQRAMLAVVRRTWAVERP